MQRLWLTLGGVFAVLFLAVGTYTAVNVIAHEEITERETFPAAEVTGLDIDSKSGDVMIVGDDVNEISLVAEIDHGLRRTTHSAEVVGTTLEIRDDCPTGIQVWCRVDYHIVVPVQLAVDVETHNGKVTVVDLDRGVRVRGRNGPVEVTGVSGDLDLHTSNGPIAAHGVDADSATAHTSNGSISLTFARSPHTVDVRSSNGSIEVVVPDNDEAYRVDTATRFTGATDTAVRTDPGSDRSITARTSNGSVTIRYPTG